MEILIEPHTLERAVERGATREEIMDVIENGISSDAKRNRKAKYKVYDFGKEKNGKHFQHKKVEVFFLIDNNTAITVTVYVYYGTF